MLEYRVTARRIDSHRSEATDKAARLVLDTEMAGRVDAFNPAEMLLASLAACLLKGAQRVAPMLKFDLRGIEVGLHGVRQDSPPQMVRIDYGIVVDIDETDQRLDRLHRNLRIWPLSTTRTALAVHVVVAGQDTDAVQHDLSDGLVQRFGIAHSTIQREREPCGASCHLAGA